jgi:hypothetical protein
MVRIEIAPDGWTFREAESHRPFVPYGCNYTPAWSGWAPDYFGDGYWDAAKVDRDFGTLAGLGANVVKLVLSYRRILPDPQAPGQVTPDPRVLRRFDETLDLAGRHGLRVIATLEQSWHGAPAWFHREGSWYGPGTHAILARFWRDFAARYRDDGRIFAFSFCVETHLDGWGSPPCLAAWRAWARKRYRSLARANSAWGQHFATWDSVAAPGQDGYNAANWRERPEGTPENENQTNDPFLYDFQLFRERTAFEWMASQSRAVKTGDPGRLTSMGFVQWQPLLRELWSSNEGPGYGPEYNARELARAVDFLGIHFYPVYPNGDDETQLKYLELWARWAYAGKPVVLEEFNREPAPLNAPWCERVIRRSQGFVSGWLVWTLQDVPNSDGITKVCGLLDARGRPTDWGKRFAEMAPEVKAWRLQRQKSLRTVKADKRWLYTSGSYRGFLEGLLAAPSARVSYTMESQRGPRPLQRR